MTSPADRFPEQRSPDHDVLSTGMLSSAHDRAQERWAEQAAQVALERHKAREVDTQAAERRKVLEAFYAYSSQEHGVDPRSPRPIDESTLAYAVHGFVHAAVIRKFSRDGQTRVINAQRVSKFVGAHYSTFGLTRDAMTKRKLPRELTEIEAVKRKVFLTEYHEFAPDNGEEPAMRAVPRAEGYPEIGITLALQQALREDGSSLAAEAGDVVLAAYGSTFPSLTNHRIIEIENEQGIVTRTISPDWSQAIGSKMIQRVNVGSLPPDAQAETYRPRPSRQ